MAVVSRVVRTHRRTLSKRVGHGAGLLSGGPGSSSRNTQGVVIGLDHSRRRARCTAETLAVGLVETASSTTEVDETCADDDNSRGTDGYSCDGTRREMNAAVAAARLGLGFRICGLAVAGVCLFGIVLLGRPGLTGT